MSAEHIAEIFQNVFAFLVGACIGSFLNVCISRWPAGESVVTPRSRCPRCGASIAGYDNIPILSWLVLRGKCRGCALPISVVYPLVELVTALVWLAAVTEFGPRFTAVRVAIFATLLLGVTLTDAMYYEIPDGFTVFGFLFALVAATAAVFIGETLPFASLYDAFIGACVGAGAIAIAGWLGEVIMRREAMGFGDVTLMAMVGAFLGPNRTLLTVFLGALLGAVVFLVIVFPVTAVRSRRGGVPFSAPLVPFGVFLAPASLIALLWGTRLIDWYAHRVLGM
ncbi:MAG: prepilin peptidase [Gemmatimonadota bacterium]|nr:prepilin peptidase [Gemmatimonadota bacterium]